MAAPVKPVPAVPKFEETAAATDAVQPEKRKRPAVEELIKENEATKEKKGRMSNWLTEGIVVKVINKSLQDGAYHKKKGVVTKLESKFVAIVKMNECGTKLRLDQQLLETVIPNPGGKTLILNGAY